MTYGRRIAMQLRAAAAAGAGYQQALLPFQRARRGALTRYPWKRSSRDCGDSSETSEIPRRDLKRRGRGRRSPLTPSG